ncbi:MAG: hypothetical protein GSR79_09805 [Desulfurococcales archaeon]|nr:hypothetical protein [Desulfurococcales archaeon]
MLSGVKQYKGVAYLRRLKLLCGRCHLAKHQGYALVHGKEQEALEHLAALHQLHLEETKKLVDGAFSIHSKLSDIDDWVIKIGELKGLDEGLRRGVEELLNAMYRKGLFISGGWLYYQCPKYYEEVKSRIISETMAVLAEASNRSGTTNIADDKWIGSLLETLRKELEPRGVQVLFSEFKLFIEYLLEEEKRRKLLQRIVDCASKGRTGSLAENIPLLLDYASLAGKWMIFVPADLYPQIFRYTLEALEKAKLAYSAKIHLARQPLQQVGINAVMFAGCR